MFILPCKLLFALNVGLLPKSPASGPESPLWTEPSPGRQEEGVCPECYLQQQAPRPTSAMGGFAPPLE
jgi:hypothetical protein